jgi:hypothetical protein
MLIPNDRHSVETIPVHQLEGGPQLGFGLDTFQLFQRKHDLADAGRSRLWARHFLDPMQGYQALGPPEKSN